MLVPYLKDRPLVLTRYPDGITGKSFYQKDAPDFVPSWVRTERVWAKEVEREIDYFVVNDLEALRYIVNLGAIPLHLWGSRAGSLERPDWLILDLDPKGAPFTDVMKVARALRKLLDTLELPSYVKTSGATGLHILLPLGARYTYDETRTFARLLATLGVEAEPEISTIVRPCATAPARCTRLPPERPRPADRGPVLRTSAAGRAGFVSAPLAEVTPRLDPRASRSPTMLERLTSRRPPSPRAPRGHRHRGDTLARRADASR